MDSEHEIVLALALPVVLLAGLLALWAVTSDWQWFWRALPVVGWLTLAGHAAAPELLLLFAAEILTVTMLVIVRRRIKRRAARHAADHVDEEHASPQDWQFSLRDVLLSGLLAGLFMATLPGLRARAVERPWPGVATGAIWVWAGVISGGICCLAGWTVFSVAVGDRLPTEANTSPSAYRRIASRGWLRYLVALIAAGGLGTLLGLVCYKLGSNSWGKTFATPDPLALPAFLAESEVALWLMLTVWLRLWQLGARQQPPGRSPFQPGSKNPPYLLGFWKMSLRVLLAVPLLAIALTSFAICWNLARLVPIPPDAPGAEQEARLVGIAAHMDWSAIPGRDPEVATPDERERFVMLNAIRLLEAQNVLARRCSVRVNYSGFSTTSITSLRDLAYSFDVQSRVAVAGGDYGSAAVAGRDCFRLGSRGQRSGLMVNKLVGCAIESVGIRLLVDASSWLDRDQRRALDSDLAVEERTREPLDDVCMREYAWAMNANGWIGRFEYLMERTVGAQDAEPNRRNLEGCESRSLAQLRLLRATLAIRFYRHDEGHFPPALAALAPNWLDAVPIDPFSGQPLIYHVDEEGYSLYSVGPNAVDDGGRIVGPQDIDSEGDLFLEMYKFGELTEVGQRAAQAAEAAAQARQFDDAGVEP